jgi:endonuclease YncB( thermonuclease family)
VSESDPPQHPPDALLNPLSIQAAALVRSIDALSNIFWISIAGTFLTIFFAGLSQLEVNADTDYIFLGEYQVPKSILPLASVAFAMFAFWMTANRLNMLSHVLATTRLPDTMVHEIFHLNPPVLHVFDANNTARWSPFTGVSVLVINWAVFFGNGIALTWASAVQRGASIAEFDGTLMAIYAILTLAVIGYGVRSIVAPLRRIIFILHRAELKVGWPRQVVAIAIIVVVFVTNHIDQFVSPSEQPDDLLGPAIANAIDGETLFIRGVEVKLFGIDAVEARQICQDSTGQDYPCGALATRALQALVQNETVVCLPLFAVNESRLVAACEIWDEATPKPMTAGDYFEGYHPNSLSRLMVVQGHALGVGVGRQLFGEEQNEAQVLRSGIWQGSFQPPSSWRADH